ncbi:hypothetical protein F5J12DRAFT_392853 [Pisolithus orientalis]|uniref:uncharacterized protein n=1 Tax=Pisolithus orientalis TaxID=936130 RepID=UPI0022247C67|nr:uncharacterized protein F5J12DRAFT_392853 [Pisolithus orientalis]KAI6028726.1 hypothetical protein F5J12DRAFT_392853 [Pisolithus orientalis]
MLPFNPGWSSFVILVTELLSVHLLRATAQQTTAVCLSQYEWMGNSKGQNPCLIAAYVQSVCSGGQYTVYLLNPNTYYAAPSVDEANPCECNTVTYSLMSACSICQNRTYITWSSWSDNCSTIYIGYPESIPSGTAIPEWAYQNVITSDDFNVTLARVVGDSPESTATEAATTTSTISTSTSLAASLTSAPSTSASLISLQSTPKSSNSGAIVGGAVGGAVGLAVIAALARWFFFHRRQQVTPSNATGDGTAPGVASSTCPLTSTVTQPLLYDPSNPNTFPTSPTMQAFYSNGHQHPSFPSSLNTSQCQHPGGYTGAPEL